MRGGEGGLTGWFEDDGEVDEAWKKGKKEGRVCGRGMSQQRS